mmetsp:Transcript_27970/g.81873  ORF Transcript_27970/g.81873 Transcript_27970/m.81873 type:complete len:379 (-) Transcript_27970:54-1190(-)
MRVSASSAPLLGRAGVGLLIIWSAAPLSSARTLAPTFLGQGAQISGQPAASPAHWAEDWLRTRAATASAHLRTWHATALGDLNATVSKVSETWARRWHDMVERRRLALASRRSAQGKRRVSTQQLQSHCIYATRRALQLIKDPGWVLVADVHGVKVWRMYLAAADVNPWFEAGGHDQQLVPVVLASGVLDVSADVVFDILKDNRYVSEYNENCKVVMDLEKIDQDTKVTWAATNRFGPFKARDFCTLIHFKTVDYTKVVVNFAVQHPRAPPSDSYVRSEILLAATILRSRPDGKTELTTVTCINPGGAADSRAGAVVMNSLSTNTPATFIRRLEATSLRYNPGSSRSPLRGFWNSEWLQTTWKKLEQSTGAGTTWGCF